MVPAIHGGNIPHNTQCRENKHVMILYAALDSRAVRNNDGQVRGVDRVQHGSGTRQPQAVSF